MNTQFSLLLDHFNSRNVCNTAIDHIIREQYPYNQYVLKHVHFVRVANFSEATGVNATLRANDFHTLGPIVAQIVNDPKYIQHMLRDRRSGKYYLRSYTLNEHKTTCRLLLINKIYDSRGGEFLIAKFGLPSPAGYLGIDNFEWNNSDCTSLISAQNVTDDTTVTSKQYQDIEDDDSDEEIGHRQVSYAPSSAKKLPSGTQISDLEKEKDGKLSNQNESKCRIQCDKHPENICSLDYGHGGGVHKCQKCPRS